MSKEKKSSSYNYKESECNRGSEDQSLMLGGKDQITIDSDFFKLHDNVV